MDLHTEVLSSTDAGPPFFFTGLAGAISFEVTGDCKPQWRRLIASGCGKQPDVLSGDGYAIGRYSHLATGREGDGLIVDPPYVIAYEGRITNRRELCDELGLRSEANTDTELLHAGFVAWKELVVTRLAGPFVLVILDLDRKTLFAATDPMGLRQFFFHTDRRQIVFAPDVRQVIEGAGLNTHVSREKLCEFLSPISVIDEGISHPTRSYFDGVSAVPSGSYLSVSLNREPSITKYWHPPTVLFGEHRSLDDWADEFRDLFFNVLDGYLHSDHPIGLELSGGVDSGAIACVSQQIIQSSSSQRTMRSYTIAFDDESLQAEDAKAGAVLNACQDICGTTIRGNGYVGPLEASFSDIRSINSPCRMNLPHAYVAVAQQAASDGCRMLLSGEGADWYLEGSDLIWDSLIRQRDWRTLKQSLGILWSRNNKLLLARYLYRYGLIPLLPKCLSNQCYMKEYYSSTAFENVPNLFCESFQKDLKLLMREQYESVASRGSTLCWEQRLEHDLMFPPNHGWQSIPSPVELCLPYLDHRLVEYGLRVPPQMKFSLVYGGTTHYGSRKLLQRVGLRGIVPPEVLDCQEKGAYSSPVVARLKHQLPRMLVCGDLAVADFELIQAEKFRHAIEDFLISNDQLENPLLPWLDAILALELWLKETFEK